MTEGAENGQEGTSDGPMPQEQGAVTPHITTDAGDDVSDDEAMTPVEAAAYLLKVYEGNEVDDMVNAAALYAPDLANHILATEARLDVALRGALQSREEMREWLGSQRDLVRESLWRMSNYDAASFDAAWRDAEAILAALIAAMPGGDA